MTAPRWEYKNPGLTSRDEDAAEQHIFINQVLRSRTTVEATGFSPWNKNRREAPSLLPQAVGAAPQERSRLAAAMTFVTESRERCRTVL